MRRCIAILAAILTATTVRAGWQDGPALPKPAQEIYPAVWQGQLVVAGGLTGNNERKLSVSASVWQFDGKQWQTLPSLPEPRHHPFLITVGGTLFSVGGFIETPAGQWSNTSDVMALTGQGWEQRASLPISLSETVAAEIDGRLHVAGGRTVTGAKNGSWADSQDTDWHGSYDPATNLWHNLPPLPLARNSACSVVVNGQWHVIGGRTVSGGNCSRHDVYTPQSNTWTQAASMPQAQGGLACASLNGSIYVFGGEYFDNGGGGVYDAVWRYDTKTGQWDRAGTMPLPRHGLGAVTHNGAIWVIGGAAQAGAKQTSDRISIYAPD